MSLDQRVEKLEMEVRKLKDDLLALKREVQGKEESDQINVVEDYVWKQH